MPLPTPAVPLKDHCSVIYNDVLYTYQNDAFQSLDLTDGATWKQLPMGVPTSGSTCVQGQVNNDQAFIVVGGTTSTQNYNGLQHYSFSSNQWTSDQPLDGVATERVGHGSAYLQQSSSILVYAGSQDNNYSPSSQTFLMQTTPPYNVQAFSSDATPTTNPLMMPWNSTHALMLGGGATNTALFIFGPQDGWHRLDVSLQNALKDSSKVQASLLTGSDGSKVLEIFDMSTSPNQITTLLLQNATSTSPSSKRSYIPSQHHPSKRRKRDTTLASRPAYNSTGAPQDSRDGFSLAQDPKTGLVVASGGDDQVPLAIFNSTGNQWVDPNAFFGNEPSPTSSSPPSSHPTSTGAGSTASSGSASGPAADQHVENKSLKILGGVLGGVFGVAIFLVLILLLLRFCRKRQAKKRERQESSYALDDKQEMDFQDVGADYMKEAGFSPSPSNHRRNRSDKSDVSVQVKAADRAGAASSQSKRALLHAKGDSAGSGKSFWSRNTKSPDRPPPVISAPIMGDSLTKSLGSPERTEPRTDTGWSTYFTENNTKEFGAGAVGSDLERRPATYLSGSQSQTDSDYTSRVPSSHPHASAEVEPLSIRASQNPSVFPPNARVMSPTGFPRPGLALSHGAGLAPRDEPPTPSTLVSDIDEEEERHRFSHSDGQDSWSPVNTGDERTSPYTDPRTAQRISSVYDPRYPHPGERVRIPNFPAVPPSQRGSVNNSQVNLPTSPVNDSRNLPSDRGLRNIASKDFVRTPSGRTRAVPAQGTGRLPDYGASQVRTFPRKKEDLGARGRGSSQTEDMSWLNLGTSAEQSNGTYLRYGP
ncbi:hypothetical protein P7C71_g2736, partial [Lecanoromycetidae sp. Uapishka_2]